MLAFLEVFVGYCPEEKPIKGRVKEGGQTWEATADLITWWPGYGPICVDRPWRCSHAQVAIRLTGVRINGGNAIPTGASRLGKLACCSPQRFDGFLAMGDAKGTLGDARAL